MKPEQTKQEQEVAVEAKQSVWNTVTPLSKYLAMALFIILPFVGGYIGYTFAPEKVVEVEKLVEIENVDVQETEGNIGLQKGNFATTTIDQGEYTLTLTPTQIETTEIETRRQEQVGVENAQVKEVWHLETSFGSEFLIEPDDSYLRGSYELVSKYQLANFDYGLRDTEMANLNPNLFYAVGTLEDKNTLLRIDTQNETFEELVTLESQESDYAPGLALSNDDQGVIFYFPSCRGCAPVILDKAVYLIDQNDYQTIGITSRFEWIDGGYRYKSIPDGCASTFNATYEPTPSEICEQKADSLDWVVVTP